MRMIFLHYESVMQPLGRMFTAAETIQWLYQLAENLMAYDDVQVVLFGSWEETYPPASGEALMHSIGQWTVGTASPSSTVGAIEAYLYKRGDVVDFVLLDEPATELPASLQEHFITCEPGAGLRDASADEVREWLAGRPRPRDAVALSWRVEDEEPAEIAEHPHWNTMEVERVAAVVTALVHDFLLVHLEAPGDLTLSIGRRTPGVDWRQLQVGQRVECDFVGHNATRVIRARVLPPAAPVSGPSTNEGPTK